LTNFLVALVIGVLATGVAALFPLFFALLRQNGRLLLRIDALERAILDLDQAPPDGRLTAGEANAFLLAHPDLSFRDGSNDVAIFHEVVYQNCYRLPPRFTENDVVIDVGAHVGLFALAALSRGCGEVYCFEPDAANSACARRHQQSYGRRACLTEAAVWRSDREERHLHFQANPDRKNLGGGDVIHAGGCEVPALALDDILWEASHGGGRRIRLAKLDCEGSEYPILLTSRLLHLVDEVCGEYHSVPAGIAARWDLGREFTIERLASCLGASGFEVSFACYDNTDSNALGLFFANRRVAVDGP
jgi:FkbM family methyltransferase